MHVRQTCVADGVIAAVCFWQVSCMLMTKDESTLITGDSGGGNPREPKPGSVIVWDMSSGERKSTLKADGPVRCFASCGGALCVCGLWLWRWGGARWFGVVVSHSEAGRAS